MKMTDVAKIFDKLKREKAESQSHDQNKAGIQTMSDMQGPSIMQALSNAQAQSNMQAAPSEQEFGSFSNLPKELRLKIWGMVPEGRIIEVRFPAEQNNYSYLLVADQPSVLYVNHESREEGLRSYKSAFNTCLIAQNAVHFNPKIDTLYISCNVHSNQLVYFEQQNAAFLKTVEKLAIPIVHFANAFSPWNEVFDPRVIRYENLKEVMLLSVKEQKLHKATPHDCPNKRNRVCIRTTTLLGPKIDVDVAEAVDPSYECPCTQFKPEKWLDRIDAFKGTVLEWEKTSGKKWSFPVFSHGEMYAACWAPHDKSYYI